MTRSVVSTAGHSPGPWTLGRDHALSESYTAVSSPIWQSFAQVVVRMECDDKDNQVGVANARLIAAAPELLALAKRYASECADCGGRGFVVIDEGVSGRGPDDVEPTREHCGECEDIRAAIAKAEGRS